MFSDDWILTTPNPYRHMYATTVSSRDAIYLLGGSIGGNYISKIYRFSDAVWTDYGDLRNIGILDKIKAFSLGNQHIVMLDGSGIEVWNEDFSVNLAWYDVPDITINEQSRPMFLVDEQFCSVEPQYKSVLQLGQRNDLNLPLLISFDGM